MATMPAIIKIQLDPTEIDKVHEVYRAVLAALVDSREDLITLVTYMAEYAEPRFSALEVAYAVEKPWKFTDTLAEAKAVYRNLSEREVSAMLGIKSDRDAEREAQ